MMKRLILVAVVLASLFGLSAVAQAAVGDSIKDGVCLTAQNQAECQSTGLFSGGFKKIANVLIFLTGAVAMIMVIIGGLRYVLSQGNPGAVEGAKNTILYAVIGLIIAIMSYAIVNFVLDQVAPAPPPPPARGPF